MLLVCPVFSIEQRKQKSQQANQNEKSNESNKYPTIKHDR